MILQLTHTTSLFLGTGTGSWMRPTSRMQESKGVRQTPLMWVFVPFSGGLIPIVRMMGAAHFPVGTKVFRTFNLP